jgi:ribosomal-protein-alanine N-acetyltransferase
MTDELHVEPLGLDILAITTCLVIDVEAFPRPALVLPRDVTRRGSQVWVCRSGATGEILGFLAAHRVGDTLHLSALAAGAAYRRRGVGRALLATAVAHAKKQRLARVALEVHKDNEAAILLYENQGFSPVKTLPSYYGRGQHALAMVLDTRPQRHRAPRQRSPR